MALKLPWRYCPAFQRFEHKKTQARPVSNRNTHVCLGHPARKNNDMRSPDTKLYMLIDKICPILAPLKLIRIRRIHTLLGALKIWGECAPEVKAP